MSSSPNELSTRTSNALVNADSALNGGIEAAANNQPLAVRELAPSTATATSPSHEHAPGRLFGAREQFRQHILGIRTKAPLQQQCREAGVHFAKSWTVAQLRDALLSNWDTDNQRTALNQGTRGDSSQSPLSTSQAVPGAPHGVPFSLDRVDPTLHPSSPPAALGPAFEFRPTAQSRSQNAEASSSRVRASSLQREDNPSDRLPDIPHPLTHEEILDDIQDQQAAARANPDAALITELGLQGPEAQQVLDYDTGVDIDLHQGALGGAEDEGEEDEEQEGEDEEEDRLGDQVESNGEDEEGVITDLPAFKTKTLVGWAQRAEGNRRPGGLRTQKGLLRYWQEFIDSSMKKGEVEDDIVDEHSLLLFIDWCSKRCKRNRRGHEIPGTLIGASQIKKHFFSVLRVRKEQQARDKTLASRRPGVTVHVWDALKTAMDEAVKRVRSGLVGEDEDAPDIIFNTFLDSTTEDEMRRIGEGFLRHRELRCTINGHLAWTWQNATGNRGDDVRALKIAELQPYEMLHPNNITKIFCVLALQGEEKAGVKGMQSRINPSYSVIMAHRIPERDPLGALMMYFHYLWDVRDITKEVEIDWSLNKTWRRIRLLHGKGPEVPLGEQGLLKLYDRAMEKAEFKSRIKQHLPRHLMPYRQRDLGVPPDETSKLGWKRGQTYHDVYAPALAKNAILGCHGFKTTENYDPTWTRVEVPEHFLGMVCPMAERIVELVKGRENLRGATAFWEMIIALRPYMFQSAAAIYQTCPTSPIFKLPALAHPEVQMWMKTVFPEQLELLQAQAGVPFLSERSANSELGMEMRQMVSVIVDSNLCLRQIRHLLDRRTAILSPTQGYSHDVYLSRALGLLPSEPTNFLPGPANPPSTPPRAIHVSPEDSRGVYSSPDGFRAFVSDSPQDAATPRPRTQVDLVLPPAHAFSAPGHPLTVIPPVMGLKGVSWLQVFKLVKQPELLWDVYKPLKSLDGYETVEGLWSLYTLGEPAVDAKGRTTGMKPPLQLLEETFKASWRKDPNARKTWQRFREIPEWVLADSKRRGVTTNTVIQELEERRCSSRIGLNALMKQVKLMREDYAKARANSPSSAQDEATPDAGEEEVTVKKKRSKPIDPRKPSKRIKS